MLIPCIAELIVSNKGLTQRPFELALTAIGARLQGVIHSE